MTYDDFIKLGFFKDKQDDLTDKNLQRLKLIVAPEKRNTYRTNSYLESLKEGKKFKTSYSGWHIKQKNFAETHFYFNTMERFKELYEVMTNEKLEIN
jgi:hypothetical protein